MRFVRQTADVEPPPADAFDPCPAVSPPSDNTPDEIANAAARVAAEYGPCQIRHEWLARYVRVLRAAGIVK